MRDGSVVETVQSDSEEVLIEASPSRRKRRAPEEIRRRLLDAAREEFKARGFARATTAAIARRAEVAEIQMFRYFPTKADLFREAIFAPLRAHVVAFHAEHTPLDMPEMLDRSRIYLGELAAFLRDNARVLISLLAAQSFEQSAAGAEEGFQAYLGETVSALIRRTGQPVDDDRLTSMRVAFGAMLGCVTYRDWLFPEESTDAAKIDAAIVEFIISGLGSIWFKSADSANSRDDSAA